MRVGEGGDSMERTALIGVALVLSACATQPTPNAFDPPGFLMGFLHGFLSLFSLVGSFFWDVRVYAFPNSGRWYDVGFVLGAACFFGATGRQSFDKSYVLGYADSEAAARSQHKQDGRDRKP
jgi:hypothetical protein